jgi:hypothetical protein
LTTMSMTIKKAAFFIMRFLRFNLGFRFHYNENRSPLSSLCRRPGQRGI